MSGIFLLGAPGTGFYQLKLGGGGLASGLCIAPDGTRVCRTDVGGAYVYNTSSSQWDQLVTTTRMPATDSGQGKYLNGVYEIVIAPSDSTRFYMAYGVGDGSSSYVFRSNNRGTTWARTSTSGIFPVSMNANNQTSKTYGPKMGVDPNNPDVVYLSIEAGNFYVTTDGGSNWASVPNVTNGTGSIPGFIAFDPASATSGSPLKTQGIYIFSNGSGVWHSTNGGTSFSLMSSSPTALRKVKVSSGGVFYATNADVFGTPALWRYNGTWTDIKPAGSQPDGIVVSPFSAGKLICVNANGSVFSTTAAATGAPTWAGGNISPSKTSPEIPWMAINEPFMGVGETIMDPLVADRVHFAEGIDMWYSTTINDAGGDPNWVSQSKGIEELVSNIIISPPGGNVICGMWDRAIFTKSKGALDSYPTTYGPNFNSGIPNGSNYTQQIENGWGLDWATTDPATIVCFNNNDTDGANINACYSNNNGVTWSYFTAWPVDHTVYIGGCIAASTSTNFVIAIRNDGDIYNTKNGGVTWTKILASKFLTGGGGSTGMQNAGAGVVTGWGHSRYYNNHIVCADRVTSGTFYAYNANLAASGGGLYRSTDGGDNWVLMKANPIGLNIGIFTGINDRLKSVRGNASHLFFTTGEGGDSLFRSTDGGANWQAIATVGNTYDVATGAIKPGGDYPTVYLAGVVGGVYGIWRGDGTAIQWAAGSGTGTGVTWTKLGDFPLNSTDLIKTIEGDADIYGQCYAGFANGIVYYKP